MPKLATVSTVTAPPGSGKSYSRLRWLMEVWLRHHKGVYWTNLALNVPAIAEHLAKKLKQEPDAIAARIRIIGPETEREWMRDVEQGGSGPWDYFQGIDLDGARIVIDEAHHFCGPDASAEHKTQWANFLKELRHRKGATCELLDQDTSGIAKEIHSVAETRKILTNCETDRDPFFKIQCADWYELRAAFDGEYVASVREIEERKVGGKWKPVYHCKWKLDPFYFRFFDSYSAPKDGAGEGGAPEDQHWYQRMSRPRVAVYFLRRNWPNTIIPACVAAGVIWLCCGGLQSLAGNALEAAEAKRREQVAKLAEQGVGVTARTKDAGVIPGNPQLPATGAVPVAGAERPSSPSSPPSSPAAPEASDPSSIPSAGEANRPTVATVPIAEWERMTALVQKYESASGSGSRITAFLPARVMFDDGRIVGVKETIYGGTYDGRRLEAIDLLRREAVLDDGTRLSGLRVPDGLAVGGSAGPSAVVPGGVPGPAGRGGGGPAGGPAAVGGPHVHNDGRGSAVGFPPPGRVGGGGLDRQ